MAFRNCLAEAAKFLSIQIPGKGKSTYTKHFEAGLIIPAPMQAYHPATGDRIKPPSEQEVIAGQLRTRPDMQLSKEQKMAMEGWERSPAEVWGDWVFVPSTGVAGTGKRVWRCYPMINAWVGSLTVLILDDTITEDIFRTVFSQAGQLIGIGRFRVRNRGSYGRFNVNSLKWSELK